MTDWPKHILEWLKTSPRYFLPIAVSCAVILFSPERIVIPLGLIEFREKGKFYLGLAMVFSCAAIVCDLAVRVGTWIKLKNGNRLRLLQMKRRLHNLTPEEKKLLRQYIKGKTRTLNLDIESGVVSGLVSEKIIYMASNIGIYSVFAYNIQPWAWDYLNKHSNEVLRIHKNDHPQA